LKRLWDRLRRSECCADYWMCRWNLRCDAGLPFALPFAQEKVPRLGRMRGSAKAGHYQYLQPRAARYTLERRLFK
jgi:hypothetical protein